MTIIAVGVFIALFFVDAGYGKFYNRKWGPAIGNRLGWVLMESPVFIAMLCFCLLSDRSGDIVRLVIFSIFQIHYLQRAFIFPFLIRGRSKMPLSIILMGMIFNTLNACMQGGWLFYISPDDYYGSGLKWLTSSQFIIGTVIFFLGMFINIHSDYIIRHLRKPGDTAHYMPKGGMFRWVTSANYFGEFTEWVGFAILSWSLSGAVFAIWTFANLGPRAARIYRRYQTEFPDEFNGKRLRRMIPFIY